MATSSAPYDHETEDVMPVQERTTQLTRTDPSRTDQKAEHDNEDPITVKTFQIGRISMSSLCRTVLDDVNTILLQHTTNLLNIIHIHASNTDTTLELAVTILNNFDLKRDTVQTEDDFPAQ